MNVINFRFYHVRFCKDFRINGVLQIKNQGEIVIGNKFLANAGKSHNPIGGDTVLRLITHLPNAKIEIGNNVGMSNCSIICFDKIDIGSNVLVGGGVKIWDSDFHILNPIERKSNTGSIKIKPVKICDNVFVGGGSIILKGLTIGENSIVGAGSVVSKSIPSNEIWAGNPAEFVRKIK